MSESCSGHGEQADPMVAQESSASALVGVERGVSWWGVANHVIPLLGTMVGIVLVAINGITLEMHLVAIVMAFLTGLGVTVGFHRLFVHRSFETYRPVAWLLAILGCMKGEASVLLWVSEHRKHHRHADALGDPHSPLLAGFWHAHMSWLFVRTYSFDPREVPDLLKRPDLLWIDRHGFKWYLLGLFIPSAICGLVSMSAYGALMGFLWGGLLRQLYVQHTTYLVNSATHLWGSKAYPTADGSRNSWIVALVTLGEGWHNYHHAFPYSARHGIRWWQIDVGWYVIWFMARLGLVWNVRSPRFTANEPPVLSQLEQPEGSPIGHGIVAAPGE